MNILFATSEAAPFIKTGGLGDVAYALPLALSKIKGNDVSVVLPLYTKIKEKFIDELEFVDEFFVPLAWRNVYCGIFKCVKDNITYYFIDNEFYFNRDTAYGDYDDGEKFAYFAKAVLEMCDKIDYVPDVIHHNDWQTALIPIFLKAHYCFIEKFNNVKTIFTIHNIEYQGKVPYEFYDNVLGLSPYWFDFIAYDFCLNFMVSAIRLCDHITTVSKTYADEIKDPFFSHGLHNILNEYSYKLSGIVNGIDENLFDPAKDKFLPCNYDINTLQIKDENKAILGKTIGIKTSKTTPLIGMVTRLVSHKGVDLLDYILEELLSTNVHVVILGTGDKEFEEKFVNLSYKYPDKLSVKIMFDLSLASLIYSGCDLFLMPSKSEPCGLAQMISMKYGTVPIVRETGGLKDTVTPYNLETKEGLGVTFKTYNAHDMLGAINRGIDLFYDKDNWEILQKNMMTADFSWTKSANEYMELYKN